MKDDCKIKDFTKWDLEDEFSYYDAAHLCYKVDPENREAIPAEISAEISKMFQILSEAAKKGTLYEPAFRNGTKSRLRTCKSDCTPGNISYHQSQSDLARTGTAHRDDLKYFFAERLGQKPSFLFPEMRNMTPRTSSASEEYFKLKEEDYKLWDLRTEVAYNEAACLLLDLSPHKCFVFSRYDFTYMEEFAFHKDLSDDIRANINTMRGILKEARGKEEFGELSKDSWMAMPYTPKVSVKSLQTWSEKNNICPKSLFPNEREKHPSVFEEQRHKEDIISPRGGRFGGIRIPGLDHSQKNINENFIRMRSKGEDKLSASQKEGNKAADNKEPVFINSKDYHSVTLKGKSFTLTALQAKIIKILHEEYLKGTPSIGEDTILNEIDSQSSRLVDIFRSTRGAWEALIASDRRGVFRLNI